MPPNDGTAPSNPMGVNTFDPYTHTLQASAPGAVCLVVDNRQGNQLGFGSAGWSVTNNAGTSGNSAAAGSASVVNGGDSSVLAGGVAVEQAGDVVHVGSDAGWSRSG